MPRRHPLTHATILAATVAVAFAVTGCTGHHTNIATVAATSSSDPSTAAVSDPTDGQVAYLVSDARGAMFIRWTRSGDFLNGTVDSSVRNQDIQGQHETLTGTQSGDTVSLTVGTAQWTGTIDGDALTVHYPAADGSLQQLTLTPATIDDYNAVVKGLHDAANAQASATQAANAKASAEAAVTDSDNTLSRELDAVTSAAATVRDSAVFSDELTTMNNTLSTLRADLATTVSDASNNCSNASGDASTVEGDYGTLDGDRQTLEGAIQTLGAGLDTLAQALATANDDWAKLQTALAQSPGTSATNTKSGVEAAQGKSDYAVGLAKKATVDARANAASLMATGKQLVAQANAAASRCP